jgi:hypothetical protein
MHQILATPNGISGGTLELILVVLAILVLLGILVGRVWHR